MSDEIKTPEGEQPQAADEELNSLKDLFQAEWNKAMAEADGAEEPAIQPLDYDEEEEEDEEGEKSGEAEETEAGEPAPEGKKKKKDKSKKKRSRAPLVVLIVLLVLILIPLVTYFVISVKEPDFNNFVTTYTNALSAETNAEKITYTEQALTYCTDDSFLRHMRQPLYETAVVLKCKENGYATALSYMNDNMTEEMIAKPQSPEFKSFLEIGDKIGGIADSAYETVSGLFASAGSADKIDYDAAAAALGAPDLIKTDVIAALKHIGSALEAEKTAKTKEEFNNVLTSLLSAVQSLSNMGADAQQLLEISAVKLFDAGYVYEATVLLDNNFTEETLAAPKTEAFKSMLSRIDSLKNVDVNIFETAKALYENKTTADSDVKEALGVKLPDAETAVLVGIAQNVIAGLKAEDEKNLPLAAEKYTDAISTMNALGFSTADVAERLIALNLATGDSQAAYDVRVTHITDEILAGGSESLKATVAEIDKIYEAEDAVNEAFYPFYYNAYYSGASLDKDEVNKALDDLLTDDADDYLRAYVAYFKYLTEGFTDSDPDTMLGYLEEFAKAFKDYPAFYSTVMAEVYRLKGDYKKAEELADRTLEINAADDYANAVKAMVKRIAGKPDEARAVAEKGAALVTSSTYCARELLILDLIDKDYAKAFTTAKRLFDETLTLDNCEYILILAALYQDGDNAVQEEIASYKSQVEELFENNGITVSERAQGLIDGTLTAEDVFLKEPYNLR